MEVNLVANLEQKMNRASKVATLILSTGVPALLLLARFEPAGYKKIGLILSITAFIASLLVSKTYTNTEKELKQCKMVPSKTLGRKFIERFLHYFLPYTLWCSFIGVFL